MALIGFAGFQSWDSTLETHGMDDLRPGIANLLSNSVGYVLSRLVDGRRCGDRTVAAHE